MEINLLWCIFIDDYRYRLLLCVKTTPQMTRFRDAKVCNNWLQVRIDDHRIQSDCKYKSELQNVERKKSVFGITSVWRNRARHQ